MSFKIFLLFTIFAIYCKAENPVTPYPPSGWRPQKPFELPDTYGSPKNNQPMGHNILPAGMTNFNQQNGFFNTQPYDDNSHVLIPDKSFSPSNNGHHPFNTYLVPFEHNPLNNDNNNNVGFQYPIPLDNSQNLPNDNFNSQIQQANKKNGQYFLLNAAQIFDNKLIKPIIPLNTGEEFVRIKK